MNDFFKFTTEAIGTESKRLRGARHVKADRIGSCNHVLNNVSSCTRVNLKSSWIYTNFIQYYVRLLVRMLTL